MRKMERMLDAGDGQRLHVTVWRPDRSAAASIQMVHGFGEYAGRYAEWAELFVARGLQFVCSDLRGHGKTPGKRGVTPSYARWLDDIELVRAETAEDRPVILYGHSMGGSIALNYLLQRAPSPYACAVIASPWLRLHRPPPERTLRLAAALARVLPNFTVVSSVHEDVLSHDAERVRRSKAEGLYHNRLGLRTLTEITAAGEYAIAHIGELTTPTLLMQGRDDRLVSASAVEELAERAGEALTYRPFDGLYHELHNEYERQSVFDAVWAYISRYFP